MYNEMTRATQVSTGTGWPSAARLPLTTYVLIASVTACTSTTTAWAPRPQGMRAAVNNDWTTKDMGTRMLSCGSRTPDTPEDTATRRWTAPQPEAPRAHRRGTQAEQCRGKGRGAAERSMATTERNRLGHPGSLST